MEKKLIKTVGHTVAFLRMAAIELRHIAKRAPVMDGELGHIACQLDREAEELAQQLPQAARIPARAG